MFNDKALFRILRRALVMGIFAGFAAVAVELQAGSVDLASDWQKLALQTLGVAILAGIDKATREFKSK